MPLPRPYIATVLLLGATLGSSLAWAQQPAARSTADLDRIRRQLAVEPTQSVFTGPVRADYSVRIEDSPEDLDYHFGWIYDQTTATPGYVRPWYPIHHFEMQSMMIPLEHRAQLYPAGIPMSVIGNTVGAIKGAVRKRKEREAKKQVEAEVAALKKSQ